MALELLKVVSVGLASAGIAWVIALSYVGWLYGVNVWSW